ncbi:MAG: sigma-70 family RNA polymerase sigma factor [Gammaproteobacteria bacterium]|nr:sigma-70 family RNA polymerase sigma factor [Gammaproteobacteria bacterium]
MPKHESNVVYLSARRNPREDNGVLRRIVRDHESAILRFLRARLANHHDREDVVQEIYLKLAQQQDNLEENLSMDEAQTRFYLMTMATNLIRDMHRRNTVRRKVTMRLASERQSEDDIPSPEEVLTSQEKVAKIEEALLGLPANCQRAFALSRFRDLSYREIADEMSISISMVEKHIMRALAELRTRVQV